MLFFGTWGCCGFSLWKGDVVLLTFGIAVTLVVFHEDERDARMS